MTKWKNFSLPRSFDDFGGMAKFCVNCGNMASSGGLFSEDMAYPHREKYSDTCAERK